MRIAFDATTAAFERKTGTGVYCEELIKAYGREFSSDEIYHTYRLSRRIRGAKFLLPLVSKSEHRQTLIDPLTSFRGFNYDVFHGLNTRLPRLSHCKMVATVHDLFSLYGMFSSSEFRNDQAKKLSDMIARADRIIVPASYTRDLLVKNLNIPNEKIGVVTEGVRDVFLKPLDKDKSLNFVRENFQIIRPYILFVGTLEKRKNVTGLVQAYAKLCSIVNTNLPGNLPATLNDIPDLLLIGHEGFGFSEIKKEIETSGVQNKIKRISFVNEETLAHFYRAASVFVTLSHEEGFGIPVIEALACGVPVMTSNTTSFPEVGAGHTWLVKLDSAYITQTLQTILNGGPGVEMKIRSGEKYARSLTWSHVAHLTRAEYLNCLP